MFREIEKVIALLWNMQHQFVQHLLSVLSTATDQCQVMPGAGRDDPKAPQEAVAPCDPGIAVEGVVLVQAERTEPSFLTEKHGSGDDLSAKREALVALRRRRIAPDELAFLTCNIAQPIDHVLAAVKQLRRAYALIRKERSEAGTTVQR